VGVKHGHENGYIEIELKANMGMPNLVIRGNINSKNHSSQFTLNGSSSTGHEINECLAELNDQISNLWYASLFQSMFYIAHSSLPAHSFLRIVSPNLPR
jgi:hypothetical protein